MSRSCLALIVALSIAAGSSAGCDDPLARTLREFERLSARFVDSVEEHTTDDAPAPDRPNGQPTSDFASVGPDGAKRVYYQFIDDRGAVRFTDRLDSVPAQWRDRVGFVETDTSPPMTPLAAAETRQRRFAANSNFARTSRRLDLSAVASRNQPRVILYSASWCGWCRKEAAYLDAKGVDYELRDIDSSWALEELLAKTGGKTVPVLDVDGRILTGFSAEGIDKLL